jgi:hypothetical protein
MNPFPKPLIIPPHRRDFDPFEFPTPRMDPETKTKASIDFLEEQRLKLKLNRQRFPSGIKPVPIAPPITWPTARLSPNEQDEQDESSIVKGYSRPEESTDSDRVKISELKALLGSPSAKEKQKRLSGIDKLGPLGEQGPQAVAVAVAAGSARQDEQDESSIVDGYSWPEEFADSDRAKMSEPKALLGSTSAEEKQGGPSGTDKLGPLGKQGPQAVAAVSARQEAWYSELREQLFCDEESLRTTKADKPKLGLATHLLSWPPPGMDGAQYRASHRYVRDVAMANDLAQTVFFVRSSDSPHYQCEEWTTEGQLVHFLFKLVVFAAMRAQDTIQNIILAVYKLSLIHI